MRKAKKFYAQQKIADGRLQAARQMMHEESHEADQGYDDDESFNNRQNRFGAKNSHGGRSSALQEQDSYANDTYQDIDDDGSDNDHMESRAEYNSEDDEAIDVPYRVQRDPRIHQQNATMRAQNVGKRARQ